MRIKILFNKYYPIFLLFAFFITVFFTVFFELENVNANELSRNSIKFIQVSDIHLDKNSKNKKARLYENSTELFKDIIFQINNIEDIDFVIFTGDIINLPKKSDLKNFLKEANNIKYPYYVIPGNHDIGIKGGVSKKDFVKIVNKYSKNQKSSQTYFSFEPNDNFKIIAIDGVIENRVTANGFYALKQLEWLKKELKTDKKIILASHFPIVEPIRSPSHLTINANAIKRLFNKNVIAFISGHYHVSKNILKDDVLYINTPALVEYPNSMRIIEITKLKNNKIKIETRLIPTSLKTLQERSRAIKKVVKDQACFKEEVFIIGETQ